jgi:hypothetical protein
MVESKAFYQAGQIVFSILGLFFNPIYYSFLLLDIIERFEVLKNVVRAITENSDQLIMTGILGIVLIYIYAIIAYDSIDLT